MNNIEEARAKVEAAQKELEQVIKAEKSVTVNRIKDEILNLKLTKGDLRGKAMRQLLGKDYNKIYPSK